MATSDIAKDFASVLGTIFNSFKGIVIYSKGYSMKITNIEPKVIFKRKSNEINVTFHYRFTYLRKDRKNNPLMEEELFERFIGDIIEQAINTWERYKKIKAEVD